MCVVELLISIGILSTSISSKCELDFKPVFTLSAFLACEFDHNPNDNKEPATARQVESGTSMFPKIYLFVSLSQNLQIHMAHTAHTARPCL